MSKNSDRRYRRAPADTPQRLRDWREHFGLSQDDLANRMAEAGYEMTRASLSKIERGAINMSVLQVDFFASILGIASYEMFLTPQAALEMREKLALVSDLTAAELAAVAAVIKAKKSPA